MLEQREKIATNIRKGVLEYCVLGSLANDDKYGLELAEELTKRHLTAGEGSLYPLLARMKTAGLVETRWEEGGAGRKRKYYSITEHGRVMLKEFRTVWAEITTQVDELLGGQHGQGY
ncbi:PadR family transcriptional regulator [Glutamicibacter sp.]|uniref:PadR family transcriptional regulator n=1 Tax=Glutamicibacter sp. TaxID=1931995 RepID=UPI002FDFA696